MLFAELMGQCALARVHLWGVQRGASSNGPGNEEEGRKGLIIWSQSWDINTWEATPGFLKRWGQLLHDCEGFMAASNRWRNQRVEEPLEGG